MEIIKEDKANIGKIISSIKKGRVLVLATDTVYGFVCDAQNEKAVERIFEIKKRDRSKPLPVFVENIDMAKKYALIDESQENFLKENWPGPVTVILPAKEGLSPLAYKNKTIGMRVPNYDFLNLILKKNKRPLAQTSVNISTQESLTEIEKIKALLQEEDVLIVDAGNLPKRKSSAVIDLTSKETKVLRY